MAKTNALALVSVMPHSIQQDAGRYIPRKEIDLWLAEQKVPEKDIESLREDIIGLAAAKMMREAGKLAMGQRFYNIQQRSVKYKRVLPGVMEQFGINVREGYRMIAAYKNASASFSEPVLKAAMIKGLDFVSYNEKKPLGKYTDIVQRLLPPPRNPDPAQANQYIDQLQQTYKDKRKAMKKAGKVMKDESSDIERTPTFLLRMNYRGIKNALDRIPKRQQQEWFASLVGMSMTHLGIASQKSFSPEAIPADFDRTPGRPTPADKTEAQAVA